METDLINRVHISNAKLKGRRWVGGRGGGDLECGVLRMLYWEGKVVHPVLESIVKNNFEV